MEGDSPNDGQHKYEWGWHGFMDHTMGGKVNTEHESIQIYVWSCVPRSRTPHGMVGLPPRRGWEGGCIFSYLILS